MPTNSASFTSKVNGGAAPPKFIDLQLTGSDIAQVAAASGAAVAVLTTANAITPDGQWIGG